MKFRIFSFKRFFSIIKKEFIQVKRDPVSLRMPIVMSVTWMLLFSYAINTDVDKVPTVVFDQSKTQESREYINKFVASNYFVVKYNVSSEEELSNLIDSGKAKTGLIIPTDYANDIKKGKTPKTQLIIDGTDPTTARTLLNCGTLISDVYYKNVKDKVLNRFGASIPKSSNSNASGTSLNSKVWYNPNLENKKFIIPGIIGLIIQNITTVQTAFALVREKERGTLEQIIVTPVSSIELILGKLVPYIVIGYAGFIFALSMSVFWFHVNVAGSFALLLLLSFLFVYCCLALGMILSTVSKNQTQAFMLSVMILIPSVLLSGFLFPRENMPAIIYSISCLIPLTYFMNIIRGIMLKGVGISLLWNDVIALSVITFIVLVMATLKFRKSLD